MFNELKIQIPTDCGNAPRKMLLIDFNVALITNDEGILRDNIADDITWNIVGREIVSGKEAFIEKSADLRKDKIVELRIDNMITHGYVASVNGKAIGMNQSYDFCHVYKFTGAGKTAKIKEITSYVI